MNMHVICKTKKAVHLLTTQLKKEKEKKKVWTDVSSALSLRLPTLVSVLLRFRHIVFWTKCTEWAPIEYLQYTFSPSNFPVSIEVTLAVRKENVMSAKMFPRPPYTKPQQLIFNENARVRQYWSVAVICQNMSRVYWGHLRPYLGPVFVLSALPIFPVSPNVILFVCFSPQWTPNLLPWPLGKQ